MIDVTLISHMISHEWKFSATNEPSQVGKYTMSSRIVGVALTPIGKLKLQWSTADRIFLDEMISFCAAHMLLLLFPPQPDHCAEVPFLTTYCRREMALLCTAKSTLSRIENTENSI
jgi:hypothetical protein